MQPGAITLLTEALPPVFTGVAMFEGVWSWSKSNMRQMQRYFWFLMIDVFLAVAIGGSIFNCIEKIVEDPREAFELLGKELPQMSGFYFNYMILCNLSGGILTLLRCASFLQTIVKTAIEPNLSRRNLYHPVGGIFAFNNPGWLSQGKQYARLLLGLVCTLTFAPIAPIILVSSWLYFFSSTVVSKYVMLYVYEQKFETGGRFFPACLFNIFFCLYVSQSIFVGTMLLKKAYTCVYASLLLMVLSYVAHHYIHRIHEGVINAMPLEVATSLDMLEKTSDAASEEAIRGQDASIAAKQYTQPALLVEPTIEPEVELDRFEPGESIPFEVWFGMGEPAPMRSRV